MVRVGKDYRLSGPGGDVGLEVMMPAYQLLDRTPLGRQERWEQPSGRADVLYRTDGGVLSPEVEGG